MRDPRGEGDEGKRSAGAGGLDPDWGKVSKRMLNQSMMALCSRVQRQTV
jgi:hypothetical protein